MDENPYKAPAERSLASAGFLRWPTINEWMLIVILAVLLGMLLIPDVDDSRQDVLRRYGQKGAAPTAPLQESSATQQ